MLNGLLQYAEFAKKKDFLNILNMTSRYFKASFISFIPIALLRPSSAVYWKTFTEVVNNPFGVVEKGSVGALERCRELQEPQKVERSCTVLYVLVPFENTQKNMF